MKLHELFDGAPAAVTDVPWILRDPSGVLVCPDYGTLTPADGYDALDYCDVISVHVTCCRLNVTIDLSSFPFPPSCYPIEHISPVIKAGDRAVFFRQLKEGGVECNEY